jgi:hypothetical protein
MVYGKLYRLDLRGKVWTVWIKMYDVVKSRVHINNVYGNGLDCNIGLREGNIVSPILFSLFIEDLENYLSVKVLTSST